jgi:dienelactone hydrolase
MIRWAQQEIFMKCFVSILFVLALAITARSEVKTEAVEYKHGDTVLEGYLAYDDAMEGKLPAVLVVHEWMGLGDHAKNSANKLAEMGYVAFAVDIYGKGVRAKDTKEAAELAGKYRGGDRSLLRGRINAALEWIRQHEKVDAQNVAAIGYCFGGTTVLELARSGADVKGVVSFHGGLGAVNAEDAKKIKCKVLVLHGADDPYVSAEEIAGFKKEMRDAGVDWQMIYYSGAVHSFTNPAAGNDNSKGAAYNEKADKRSWEAMRLFFFEIFE